MVKEPLNSKKIKKYFSRKNIDISNLTDLEIIELYEKSIIGNRIIGREKRLNYLAESGKITIDVNTGKKFFCKMCNKEFVYVKKSRSNEEGFCSYSCYKKTGESDLKRKKTYLESRGINTINMSIEYIAQLFGEIISKNSEESQKQRVKTIKNKGENEFSRMTKLGNYNRKKNFLVENNIVNKENIEKTEIEEINFLYKKFFNKITKHGEKIENGIKKNGTQSRIRPIEDKLNEVLMETLINYGIDISNVSPEFLKKEKNKIRQEWSKKRSIMEWKKSHFKNEEYIKDLTDDKISKMYSEYLSKRLALQDNLKNGYQHTKKGYYKFKNINKEMFFRSSWEEYVFKKIDDLIECGEIVDVGVPDRIEYFFEYKRHYYPDVFYIKKDFKKITCEIKPLSKLELDINVAKINCAKSKLGDNFKVLTEKQIFSDDLTNELTN